MNVREFNGDRLFELVEELNDSFFYFLQHPEHDVKLCVARGGSDVYKAEILQSLQQFNNVRKDMYLKLEWGGCRIHHIYYVGAQLVNGRETVEILSIVEKMRDLQSDDIYTKIGNLGISKDGLRLKKKVLLLHFTTLTRF